MFRLYIVSIILVMFGCKPQGTSNSASTSMDVGRSFIRASLDGNFTEAEKYLATDPKNMEYFKSYEDFYTKMPKEDKDGYKSASYEINKIEDVIDDSVTIINYSNSYKKQATEIKLVRENGRWAVDFKYSYTK